MLSAASDKFKGECQLCMYHVTCTMYIKVPTLLPNMYTPGFFHKEPGFQPACSFLNFAMAKAQVSYFILTSEPQVSCDQFQFHVMASMYICRQKPSACVGCRFS